MNANLWSNQNSAEAMHWRIQGWGLAGKWKQLPPTPTWRDHANPANPMRTFYRKGKACVILQELNVADMCKIH